MSDPSFYASNDVHSSWFTVREQHSGYLDSFSEKNNRYHSFYGYNDCARILRDDRTFTSRYGTIIESIDFPDTARDITMTVSDGDVHSMHRTPASRCLSKKHIKDQAHSIQSEVKKIVDAIPEGSDVDFSTYTKRLPMALFGPLLPIERDQWDELSDLVFMSILPEDATFAQGRSPETARRISHAGIFANLHEALEIQERRSAPGIFHEYLESDSFCPKGDVVESILANSYSLLMGAHATTNQVANHLVARLCERPDVAAQISDSSVLPSIINEAIRWVSPTNHLLRRAQTRSQIGDIVIDEGDWVVAWVGSANRDEGEISESHRFISERRGKHLGLGIGSHYCIGSHIATFGLAHFFNLLHQKFDIHEGETRSEHVQSNWINGYSKLPLTITRKQYTNG